MSCASSMLAMIFSCPPQRVQPAAGSHSGSDSVAQVQMHSSDGRMVVLIPYPVQLEQAAQIDEAVAQAVLNIVTKSSLGQELRGVADKASA